jgi:hypothetical protein
MAETARLEAAGIPVFFPESHRLLAENIVAAVEETTRFLQDHWRLRPPADCQVHVLTDVFSFIAETVPLRFRILVALTKPLWRKRAERAFGIAGGWMLPWPGRMAVGVKPPDLLASAKTRLGERIFEPVSDPTEKVRHITCHELTHAFSAHLRLPAWINEGLAMRAVDHVAGYPTVREETSAQVLWDPSALDSKAYRRVKPSDHEALLALYATGYWMTRRLEDQAQDTLREILRTRRSHGEVNRLVSEALAL